MLRLVLAAVSAVGLATFAAPAGAQQQQQAAQAQRADTIASPARADSAAAMLAPTLGSYNCVRTVWAGHQGGSFNFQSQGYLTLAGDGTYTFSASNRVGRYTVVPSTRALTWSGGYFADKGPLDATFGTAGAPNVEVLFHGRGGDTRWVCAHTAAREPAASAGTPAPAGATRP